MLHSNKGQFISKADWCAIDSPKKQTDEFVLFAFLLFTANKSNSSIRFLGESAAPQSAFWFYLTFWPKLLTFCQQTLTQNEKFLVKMTTFENKSLVFLETEIVVALISVAYFCWMNFSICLQFCWWNWDLVFTTCHHPIVRIKIFSGVLPMMWNTERQLSHQMCVR